LDVPSIGEFFIVLVGQLVRVGLEYFHHDIGSMGAIACGGLDCLGAALGLGPLH
jgi:hypothetical protein